MALISGVYDDEPRNHNLCADARYQRFLEHLESKVVGEPGRPRAIPEPFEPVEAMELVDGPVVAPVPPPKPPRRPKRGQVAEEFPTGDRELKALARKLTGRG